MNTAKLAYAALLVPILWLLLGIPDLGHRGNLVVFSVVVLHLFAIVWTDEFFKLFKGDAYTYGGYTLGANLVSFAVNFVTAWIVLRLHGGDIVGVGMVSPYAWGLMALSALSTIAMPLLTPGVVSPLPKASERREFENPCDGDRQ